MIVCIGGFPAFAQEKPNVKKTVWNTSGEVRSLPGLSAQYMLYGLENMAGSPLSMRCSNEKSN